MTSTGDGCRTSVAVDAVGGDNAPGVVLSGVSRALEMDGALDVHVVGPAHIVNPFCESRPRATPHPASQVIAMEDHPASAVRSKRDSSIVVGCTLVRDGVADAFVSAGSTGACMAAATLIMGRLDGVARPAIAAVIPTGRRPVVLVDVGANADCKPDHLLQFAHMGAAYASTVLAITHPRIALLNIGEESTKGSMLAQEAHALMRQRVERFVGNVEGRDLVTGAADVIVTDGFTGNVALKLLEGASASMLEQMKNVISQNPLTRMAGTVLRPGFTGLKRRLDPATYGGAPLLGVDGVCIIGHGSSGSTAIASALCVAAQAVRGSLTRLISEAIASRSTGTSEPTGD